MSDRDDFPMIRMLPEDRSVERMSLLAEREIEYRERIEYRRNINESCSPYPASKAVTGATRIRESSNQCRCTILRIIKDESWGFDDID